LFEFLTTEPFSYKSRLLTNICFLQIEPFEKLFKRHDHGNSDLFLVSYLLIFLIMKEFLVSAKTLTSRMCSFSFLNFRDNNNLLDYLEASKKSRMICQKTSTLTLTAPWV